MTIKTTRFDAAEYLDSPEAIAAYLNDAIAHGDAAELVAALGTLARAKGMSQIAREAGVGRESLYKTLSGSANPGFSTVNKVIASLGLKIAVVPTGGIVRRPRTRKRVAKAKAS